ncbi:hypothetical protein [Rubritalea tangerina]|uniref:hypothetical protein n=1 Tax=Rubritalea tangerina TaxID=430798 RepID=UPI003623A9BD
MEDSSHQSTNNTIEQTQWTNGRNELAEYQGAVKEPRTLRQLNDNDDILLANPMYSKIAQRKLHNTQPHPIRLFRVERWNQTVQKPQRGFGTKPRVAKPTLGTCKKTS